MASTGIRTVALLVAGLAVSTPTLAQDGGRRDGDQGGRRGSAERGQPRGGDASRGRESRGGVDRGRDGSDRRAEPRARVEPNRDHDNRSRAGRAYNGRAYDNRPYAHRPYAYGAYGYRPHVNRSYVVPFGYRPYGYRPGWNVNLYFGRPHVYGRPGYGYPAAGYGYYSIAPGGAYGAVRIVDAPRDAEVFVDGYYAGVVDDYDGVFQHLNLEAGSHHIEIEAQGYPPITFDVRVAPGQTITYRADLR